MSDGTEKQEQQLAALRQEIDRLDQQIHDDLMARVAVVEQIALAKGDQVTDRVVFRPEREAAIIRSLVERHSGALPVPVVVRIWRELISAMVALQGPLKISLQSADCEASVRLRDAARDHFGASTPLKTHRSSGSVMTQVMEEPGCIGVLPLPTEDDAQPWWRSLLRDGAPKVVGTLPYLVCPGDLLEGVFLVPQDIGETGEDASLFVFKLEEGTMSRSSLTTAFSKQGLTLRQSMHWRGEGADFYLMDIEGYVTEDHPAMAGLLEEKGEAVMHKKRVGGYPLPLQLA